MNASLDKVDFRYANLSRTLFDEAVVDLADFENACLTGAKIAMAKCNHGDARYKDLVYTAINNPEKLPFGFSKEVIERLCKGLDPE